MIKRDLFALTALAKGLPDHDHPDKGFLLTTKPRPYTILLSLEAPFLRHLVPFHFDDETRK